MGYPAYDRIKHLNFIGYGHFNHGYGYNTHADYDTNAPSIEHFLGKTNAYLHYLDHIFSEILEIIADILIRLEEIEKDIDDLKKYKHVPAILVKKDDTHDYITVDNVNRTQADGLAEGLVDVWKQKHIMDTSKLDSIIDRIIKEIGLETQIAGLSNPDDGTCIELGDVSMYDELKITYDSNDFSIPRLTSYLSTKIGTNNSCTFSNIVDENPSLKVNGEIGQVLCPLAGTPTNARVCFDNSQLWRFENVSSVNNGWNRSDGSGGGTFAFSTSDFPNDVPPNYGGGWIRVIKITGVNYSWEGKKNDYRTVEDAHEMQYQAFVRRLKADNYVVFSDFNNFLNYCLGNQATTKEDILLFLDKIDMFEDRLKALDPSEDAELLPMDAKPLTRYDELVTYRMLLRGGLSNV